MCRQTDFKTFFHSRKFAFLIFFRREWPQMRKVREALHRASGKVPVESETITAVKGIRAVVRLNAGNAGAR